MENNKVSFCYSEMKDIDVELKGSKNLNANCDGCVYLDFCLKDIAGVKVKEEKTKVKDKVTKEKVKSEVKPESDLTKPLTDNEEDSVKESKSEKVTEAKSRKPKKKKESIEDLLDEDIF